MTGLILDIGHQGNALNPLSATPVNNGHHPGSGHALANAPVMDGHHRLKIALKLIHATLVSNRYGWSANEGSDTRQSLHEVVPTVIIPRQPTRRSDLRHPLQAIARGAATGKDQRMGLLLCLLSHHRTIMALMLILSLEDAEANLDRILKDGNPTSPTSYRHGPLHQIQQA